MGVYFKYMGIIRVPKKYRITGQKAFRLCQIDQGLLNTKKGAWLRNRNFSLFNILQQHENKLRDKKQECRHVTWLVSLLGEIKKPGRCSHCNRHHKYIEAHHTDYNDPRKIIWLCRPCHVRIHGWLKDPYAKRYKKHGTHKTRAEFVANDQVVHPLRPMSASPASGTDAC
jgi:hypothetical protein